MNKIFIICNENVEKKRYENMENQLKKANINKEDVEYFCKYWKTDIEKLQKENNFKYDKKYFSNLNNAEISLLINHIEILKKIKKNYSNGIFLILESDAYVYPGMSFSQEKLFKLKEYLKNLKDWDIVSIGGTCEDILGVPKNKPIEIENFKFYKENRLIGIEGGHLEL